MEEQRLKEQMQAQLIKQKMELERQKEELEKLKKEQVEKLKNDEEKKALEAAEKKRAVLVSMFLNSKEKRLEMTEYFTHEILLDEVVNGYNDMVRNVVSRGFKAKK